MLVKQYLRATTTLGIADSTIKHSASATGMTAPTSEQLEWDQVNTSTTLIILSTFNPTILHLINPNTQTAKEMMDTLSFNYSATSMLSSFTKFWQYFSHHINETRSLAEQLEE